MFKKFLIAGAFAAATFVIAFVLGGAITAIISPGTSGIVTIMFTTIIIVIGAKVIDRPYSLTIMVTLFSILAIPTNIFGPPVLLKVGIGLGTGITYDLIRLLVSRISRYWDLPIAAAISTAVSIVLIYYVMLISSHPRAEYLAGLILYLIPLYTVLGFLGGLVGVKIFEKRIKGTAVAAQLMDAETESSPGPEKGKSDA